MLRPNYPGESSSLEQVQALGGYLYYPFNVIGSARESIRGYNLGYGQWDTVGPDEMPRGLADWDEQAALFELPGDGAFSSGKDLSALPVGDIAYVTIEFLMKPIEVNGQFTCFSLGYAYYGADLMNGIEVRIVDGLLQSSMSRRTPGFSSFTDDLLTTTERLDTNKWHMVHVTRGIRADDGEGGYAIWLDGKKVAEKDCRIEVSIGNVNDGFARPVSTLGIGVSTQSLLVGTATLDLAPHPFKGVLDEIVLYFDELSPEDIVARFEASGLKGTTTMSERSSVYEGSYWRAETTPGSGTGTLYRLLGTDITLDPVPNIRTFKRSSAKYATSFSHGKEYSKGTIMGDQAFNDLLFMGRGIISKGTKTTPADNGVWAVVLGGATAGTWAYTVGGQTALGLAYNITATALQTAINGLSSVGGNLFEVTGDHTAGYIVAGLGHAILLGAHTADFTGLTAAVSPGITSTPGGTARRWALQSNTFGPDDTQTYEFQKGIPDVANSGAQAQFGNLTALQLKWTKDEASLTGDFLAGETVDPFTISSGGVVDMPIEPVDMSSVGVWIGKDLYGPDAAYKLRRLYTADMGLGDKNKPNITIDDESPSLSGSGALESAPNATFKLTMQHDAQGQAILANMRNGDTMWVVIQAFGDPINAHYDYRYLMLVHGTITNVTHSDTEAAFCSNFDFTITHSSQYGFAIKWVIDTAIDAF